MSWKALTNSSVLAVAVVYGLLLKIAFEAGMFGIVLATIVHISLWRYAYTVLRSIAQGRPNVPAPDAESLNPFTEWRLVVHYLFDRLIEADRAHTALELVAQCRRVSPDFNVAPATAERLAAYARTIGRHGVADGLAALSPRAPSP